MFFIHLALFSLLFVVVGDGVNKAFCILFFAPNNLVFMCSFTNCPFINFRRGSNFCL